MLGRGDASMIGRASASASCPARCIVLLFAFPFCFQFLFCLLRCAAGSCILCPTCIECYLANVAGPVRSKAI
jgi:hypothetical protein